MTKIIRTTPLRCLQHGDGIAAHDGRSPEGAGAFGLVIDGIPFKEPLVLQHAVGHRLQLFSGLVDGAVVDELPKHARPEPGPIAAVLVTIGMHAGIFEKTFAIGRI